MISKDILPIIERLDKILNKLDNKSPNRYLSLNQVCKLTSLSQSTVRRYIKRGYLKPSKKCGKLLFKKSEILRWVEG